MRVDTGRRSVDLDPRDPGFFSNPYAAYRAIREKLPRFKWEQYGHWCFAAHADVSALLRDRRFGRQVLHVMSREELGWPETPAHVKPFYDFDSRSLLELEPPEHTRLRGLVNRAFLSREVERLKPAIETLAHELIDGFAPAVQADLLAAFATPIPVMVIADLLGVPRDMAAKLLDWSHRMVAMYQFRRDAEVERSAVAATTEFSAYMRGVAAERRRSLRNDLLSNLVAAETEQGRLGEDDIVVTAILLLNAGHEATVHAIGNGIRTLLDRAVDPGAAFADAASTAAHVEELLRIEAPLHLFTRYALEDVDLGDLRLRKGEKIGLLLGAANHDPARFTAPETFEPRRSPNPHVSFGAGIHFCVGAPLARLELQVALPILFRRLPRLRLAGTPRWRDTFHFHGLESLHVAW
jgi:cytochrome P450